MKNILLITSLLAVAFAVGCKPSGGKLVSQTTETTGQKLDEAQAATKESAHQLRDYTFEQKAEFVAAMRTELTDLTRSLDELSAKIEKSSEAVQAEAKPKLAALRERAMQLNKKLDEVSAATASTWSGIKADSDKAYTALKDGVTQSRQWISDKITP